MYTLGRTLQYMILDFPYSEVLMKKSSLPEMFDHKSYFVT